MLQVQHQNYVLLPSWPLIFQQRKTTKNRRVVSRFRCGCHGLHADTGEFKLVGQKVDREQRFCLGNAQLFVLLTRQKMNIILYLTALHIAQSGTDIVPYSGDQPLPCLLS